MDWKQKARRLSRVLEKHSFWGTMRITFWIARFLFNTRNSTERRHGVLTTAEIREQVHWWIKKHQLQFKIEEDKSRLNMEENELGLLVCKGRIQGEIPNIYILPTTKGEDRDAQKCPNSGGLRMTMAAVRKCYWIPHARQCSDDEIPPIWAHGRTARADR